MPTSQHTKLGAALFGTTTAKRPEYGALPRLQDNPCSEDWFNS